MNSESSRHSRLPADPNYWERIANDISVAAGPVLEGYRGRAGSWFGLLPRWSPALGLAAAIAVVAAFWWMPPPPPDVAQASVVERAIRPPDPLGEQLVSDGTPPSVRRLLAASAPPEGD